MMRALLLRRRGLGRTSCRMIEQFTNGEIAAVLPEQLGQHDQSVPVIRWGCTAAVNGRDVLFNSAESIHWCADKRASRLEMQEAGVPVPETWAAEVFRAECDMAGSTTSRFVIRPPLHSQGRHLVAGSAFQVCGTYDEEPRYEFGYVSRLIDKVAEYRVFLVGKRVCWVAKKTPGNPDQVAWNVAQGGRFDNVRWADWPMRVVEAALAAAKCSGTWFCGVDVMIDAAGNPYVLEVNSAASMTSEYRQRCAAKCLLADLEKPDREWPTDFTHYKHVRHPALRPAD